MKKLLGSLFGHRRWLLWLPFGVFAYWSSSSGEFLVYAIGGMVFYVPYALAWYLSDGFRTPVSGDSTQLHAMPVSGFNPSTGKQCLVYPGGVRVDKP